MVQLPKRIDPCPIVEAVLELRYQPNVPAEAVYGIVYPRITKLFHGPKNLPILELPETIRSKDPNLRYQPYYELRQSDNISLKVGPRVLTFSNTKPYQGWHEWFHLINTIFEQLQDSGLIKNAERISLRYINFFNYSLLDLINLSVIVNERIVLNETTSLRVELQNEDVLNVLQVVNNGNVTLDKKNIVGSVIDIDCIRTFRSNEDFFAVYREIAENVHKKEKVLFFGLLKPELLARLNPVYAE